MRVAHTRMEQLLMLSDVGVENNGNSVLGMFKEEPVHRSLLEVFNGFGRRGILS